MELLIDLEVEEERARPGPYKEEPSSQNEESTEVRAASLHCSVDQLLDLLLVEARKLSALATLPEAAD